MRNAECQVAAAVAADFTQVAASGLLLLADSGLHLLVASDQQARWEFVPLPVDSDQLPVFAPLAQ